MSLAMMDAIANINTIKCQHYCVFRDYLIVDYCIVFVNQIQKQKCLLFRKVFTTIFSAAS